jgi:hypothetical protein
MRRTVAAAVVLAMAIVSGALIARGTGDLRSRLTQALDTLPQSTLTANFTDWHAIRETLDATDVTSATPEPGRRAVLDAAYGDDLSAVSGLAGSALDMSEPFGWSVFEVDWEAFGQGRQGAVIVAALDEEVDPGPIVAALAELGYQRPDTGADDGGVWRGGPDRLAAVGAALTPMLEHVAVLAEERLVVLSDAPAYAARTVDTIRGDAGALGDIGEVAMTAEPLERAITTVVHRPPQACAVGSYGDASMADRELAAARIDAVGGVQAHRGLGFGIERVDDGWELVVSMSFETAADAERDRSPRTALARGPAVGQGGTYEERFDLVSGGIVGTELVLRLRPLDDRMSLLSDLASGPLLFSGCDG